MRWLLTAVLFGVPGLPACGAEPGEMAFEMLKWGDCISARGRGHVTPAAKKCKCCKPACTCEKGKLNPDCDCYPCKCFDGKENAFRILPVGPPSFDADDATIWSYAEGCDLARKRAVPLVSYVGGGRARCNPGPGRVTCYAASLPGARPGEVRVSVWVGDAHWGRPVPESSIADAAFIDKTAAEIREWAKSPPPAPAPPGCPNCPGNRCPIGTPRR